MVFLTPASENVTMIKRLAFILVILGVASCSQPETPQARVAEIKGSANLEREGKSSKLKVGDLLKANDTVTTEKGAIVDLQIKGGGSFRIMPDSRTVISQLGKSTELEVERGGLLLGLNKLKKDESFSVRSPTAVAGVRGTSFSFSADRLTIAVLTGSVEVKRGDRVVNLDPMREVKLNTDKIEAQKLSPASSRELASIAEIAGISEVDSFAEIQKNASQLILEIEAENVTTGKGPQPREKQEVQ
jgi:hypothetical protein